MVLNNTFQNKIMIFFVFHSPSDRTEKNMAQAFLTCTGADLNPEWVSEDEVRELPTRSNVVFVLKDFKGETFHYLTTQECLICGPRCIHTCIVDKLPVPENQSPVFTTAMRGIVITTTKMSKSKKEEVQKMVGYMGGTYSEDLTMAVTHLVTDEPRSSKGLKAAEVKIPIMTRAWLDAVWEASLTTDTNPNDESFRKYKLLPFKGMQITCSNLPSKVKRELQQLIEGNGGVYIPNLMKDSTSVVVIGEAEGEKFKHAQMWEILCVKPSWIHESVKLGVPVQSEEHLVKSRPKCSTPTSELPSFMNNTDISMVPGIDTTRSDINDTVSSTASVMSSAKPNGATAKAPGQDYKKHFQDLVLLKLGPAGLFLDGCKVYLSGFTGQETEKLKKILNSGGATIFMQLSDRVSHVIVGEFLAADTKVILGLQSRPHVVTVEWITASVKQKSPALVQPYLCFQGDSGNLPPPSPLSHKGLELLKPKVAPETQESVLPVSRKLFMKTSNVTEKPKISKPEPKTPKPVVQPLDKNSTTLSTQSEADTLGGVAYIFQGLVFQIIDIPEPEQVAEAIENAGGAVAGSRFHGIADYAVVPLEGTSSPVSATEVVTVLWVEDSMEQGRAVTPKYYHEPALLKDGAKPLSGAAVCVSGFVGKERAFMHYVATLLGASVQESFSRKDHPDKGILKATHLICTEASGSKYNAAVKWGVPVVTKAWLFETAKTGRSEPTEPFGLMPGVTTPAPTGSTPSASWISERTPVVGHCQKPCQRPGMGPPPPLPPARGAAQETPVLRRTTDNISPNIFTPVSANKSRVLDTPGNFVVTKRKLSQSSAKMSDGGNDDDDDDDDFLERANRGSSLKKRMANWTGGSTPNENRTPLTANKLSTNSAGPSPFHVETPESPYGQVFRDNPSPQTRKAWKKYIDSFPDNMHEEPTAPNARRLSTPLSVIKKQLLVKFGGAEVEGIDPDTGELLLDGPYKQWTHNGIPNKEDLKDHSPDAGTVLAPKISDEKTTPLNTVSNIKNTKKFVKKQITGSAEKKRRLSDETEDAFGKEIEELTSRISKNSKRFQEHMSLTEQYQGKDDDSYMNDEMMQKVANRVKTTKTNLEDADHQLKQTAANERPALEGCITWDVERPQMLKNLVEKGTMEKQKQVEDEEATQFLGPEEIPEEDDRSEMPKKIFTLSNIQQSAREKYENIIKNLGGEVSSCSAYDPCSTHIVIDKPVRSEKLLCSIASGKWVLYVSYLDQCYESRTFLPEDDFEWGNPRSEVRLPSLTVGSTEFSLAKAAFKWRDKVSELGPRALPFKAMRVVLLTTANKTPQFTRLLQAGGATVLDKKDILEATHCFVDEGKVQIPVKMQLLVQKDIHCVPPVFLGDCLTKVPPPVASDYWIESYKKATRAHY